MQKVRKGKIVIVESQVRAIAFLGKVKAVVRTRKVIIAVSRLKIKRRIRFNKFKFQLDMKWSQLILIGLI